jgi:rhodanese-related sulfurtransferase
MTKVLTVSAADLRRELDSSHEVALLDVRREGDFGTDHVFSASNVPLSQLELRLPTVVPRRTAPIVLCDADDGLTSEAVTVVSGMGYDAVSILEGGIYAWAHAGHCLFSGINVPSKAFGEYVEHHAGTPHIDPRELYGLIQSDEDIAVLDSRPFDEYRAMSIPSAISCPGGELVYRFFENVPSAHTRVVVNCAGRTRSIIGAQSLIDAGVPNPVVALRDGTMGWHLAGLELEHEQSRRARAPKSGSLALARERAQAVVQRVSVRSATWDEYFSAHGNRTRTTYLFDVRDPDEFDVAHPSGAISAPGGQLVQTLDGYAAVRNALIFLCDADGVRGAVTAAWLKQMGWKNVWHIIGGLHGARLVAGDLPAPSPNSVAPTRAASLIERDGAVVIDIASSKEYRRRHIRRALFCERMDLPRLLTSLAGKRALLTSSDGRLAAIALDSLARSFPRLRAIAGGTSAWDKAGLAIESGRGNLPDRPTDVFYRPYDNDDDVESAMRKYLEWEVNLLHRIEGEPGVRFGRGY